MYKSTHIFELQKILLLQCVCVSIKNTYTSAVCHFIQVVTPLVLQGERWEVTGKKLFYVVFPHGRLNKKDLEFLPHLHIFLLYPVVSLSSILYIFPLYPFIPTYHHHHHQQKPKIIRIYIKCIISRSKGKDDDKKDRFLFLPISRNASLLHPPPPLTTAAAVS